MKKWFVEFDKNLLTYWLALAMIFVGLVLSVSVATALIVCGSILVTVSIANSYVALWFYRKAPPQKK